MTPLVIFVIGWICGELFAEAARFPPVWFLLVLPAALILRIGWGDDKLARRTAGALIGLLLGAGRLLLAQPHIDAHHVAFYNDTGLATVEGVVTREPDHRTTLTNLHLDVELLVLPDGTPVPVQGRVLVKAPAYAGVHYGDRIRSMGSLETPPVFEDFSYRDYLARQGIHSLLRQADVAVLASHQGFFLWDWLYRFKAHALDVLLTLLPEPQASLLAGILLGVETGIPADLDDAFVATGTSHIVAISGFNLTIIAGVFVQIANRLLKGRGKTIFPLAGLWLYTLLVGASAAVVRAAVMATVTVAARRTERHLHAPTSLAAAIFFMLLANPHTLWDVGFQLSLAATLGLILYVDPLTRAFERLFTRYTTAEWTARLTGWLNDALIVTLAAQVTTMGIIVGVFHRLSLVTLLTNLLILPAQSFLMLSGGVALIAGLIVRPLGQLLAWIAWVPLTYTITAVRWTAAFPLASVELGNVTLPLVWGYYAVVGIVTWWLGQSKAERTRYAGALKGLAQWQVAVGASVVVVFAAYLLAAPDGRLHVVVLDVGQGDATFIQTPSGKQILIDGGANGPQTLSQLGRQMPFWDRRLDLVVLTSPDKDRLTGLIPVLERFDVDFVATSPEAGAGDMFEHWRDLLTARLPESTGVLWAGMAWDLDRDVTLRALWPDPGGDGGPLVLRLDYGRTSFTLTGDATTLVEDALVARHGANLHSSVLLVARHGAKTAAGPAFLQATSPEIVIISAGDSDRYPDPIVLARVADLPVYRTDVNGAVHVVSNGQTSKVQTAGIP